MKKLFNLYNILFVLGGTLFLTSCSGFLDMNPSDSADSQNAITTTADAQVVINGIMRSMVSDSYYGLDFIMYGDTKGGDLTIESQGRGLDGLYTFQHSPTSGSYSGFWTTGYNCILQINNLLQNIGKIEAAGGKGFDKCKGEALTLRALIYFDLVRLYGLPYNYKKTSYGVPLITTPLTSDAKPGRATVEEIYTQILADLKDGATLLSSDKKQYNGYIGYYGNLAEQARVKLYMEDYDGALAAAKEIIEKGPFSLYSNLNWIASWSKQFGSESIFEISIDANQSDLGTSSLGFYLLPWKIVKGASGWFMASDYFLSRLNQDATDVRWGVMTADETSTNAAPHLGSCYKYMGGPGMPGDGKETNTAVNIKVIRLSEIYLIAAEAELHCTTPDRGQASTYLNKIRCRAPQLAAADENTITDDMILDERSKELFGEGQRFFDMIRMNKTITYDDELGNIPVTQRGKTVDRTFGKIILPISQDEINANPTLKTEQNEAYQ